MDESNYTSNFQKQAQHFRNQLRIVPTDCSVARVRENFKMTSKVALGVLLNIT